MEVTILYVTGYQHRLGLSYSVWDQGVAGSNPVFPTLKALVFNDQGFFIFPNVSRCDPLILNFGSQMGRG